MKILYKVGITGLDPKGKRQWMWWCYDNGGPKPLEILVPNLTIPAAAVACLKQQAENRQWTDTRIECHIACHLWEI